MFFWRRCSGFSCVLPKYTWYGEGFFAAFASETVDFGGDERNINYKRIYETRIKLLKTAYKKADLNGNQEYLDFIGENVKWLEDYALFMALKDYYGGLPWYEWDYEIKSRKRRWITRLFI